MGRESYNKAHIVPGLFKYGFKKERKKKIYDTVHLESQLSISEFLERRRSRISCK